MTAPTIDRVWMITYETLAESWEDWELMPNAIPIKATHEFAARLRFGKLFEECFGTSIDYWILKVNQK